MTLHLSALRACTCFCFIVASMALRAQAPSAGPPTSAAAPTPAPQASPVAILSGAVLDPSGAAIPQATVHLHSDAADREAVTDVTGHFTLSAPAATYVLSVQAVGFRDYARPAFTVSAQRNPPLNITLGIATAVQEVNVPGDPGLSTDSGSNKSALVFSSDQLETFSNDPATMNQQLLALAGSDPSNPPQLYVDGFSNGTLPPKESIREIRINQNPFSAQYDSLGYGRIEVLTKPGANKLHGGFEANIGNSALNARNPYTGIQPAYSSSYYNGNVNGPIGRSSSFFLSGARNHQASNAVVNAITGTDSNGNNIVFSEAVPNPLVTQNYSVRFDRQLGAADTVIGRYNYTDNKQTNGGVGQLVLPSEGYNSFTRSQTLQLSDTHLFGTKVVLDAKLQYIRTRLKQDPVSTDAAIIVQGAFSGGGSPLQSLHDNQDRLELQDYFSISHGTHFLRTGIRYRLLREANLSDANFNGQFTFSNLAAYQAKTPTPSQFSISKGEEASSLITGDAGIYAEDEWKATPNLTLNYGFRIESQSAIPDHFDFAPRLGAAYSVMRGKKAKSPFVVLRGGFGMFYTRFASTNLLQSLRQNGVAQQDYIVTNPDYNNPSNFTASPPTIYEVNPHLHSPYAMFGVFTVERSLGSLGNFSVSTFLRRSVHQFESLNINAPLPGTYTLGVPASGTRPMGGSQNVFQYSSDGVANGRTLNGNVNIHASKRLSFWAFASMSHQAADVLYSSSSFVSNSYNVGQDYGPSTGFSPRQLYSGIDVHPGWDLAAHIFVALRSHSNFNITTGQDNNGDTIFNDRPSFATDLTRTSVVRTSYGNFDTLPVPGQTIIPINYGIAPGLVYTELYIDKNIRFGPRPPADAAPAPGSKPAPLPEPRYNLQFGIGADNLFNHVNPGVPVGVLSSPFFGRSISLNAPFTNNTAANRALTVRTAFYF